MKITRNALGWACVALIATAAPAQSQTLFYSGDLDQNFMVSGYSRNYENFHVGAGGWHVNGLFGDFLTTGGWSFADYEIRSGVNAQTTGNLLFSGLKSATQTSTGRSAFGMSEYRASVSGLNFFLGEGDYWIAMSVFGDGYSYNSPTAGLNDFNSINDLIGYSNQNSGDPRLYRHDFSYGMYGTQGVVETPPQVDGPFGEGGNFDGTSTTVPEPSTYALMASGLAALGFMARRRKAQQA